MAKISVTRALAQKKALNDKIQRATSIPFITALTGGKHATGKTEQELVTTLKASIQSVKDLIDQRKVLTSAIVRSNAVTEVTIAEQKMTVAEAIERKSSIQFEKALLNTLKQQLAQVNASVERTNVDVQRRLEDLLKTAVGKDRKVDDSELRAITDPFRAQNEAKALDPNDVAKLIESLQTEIDAFELEVDFALSEVNATTLIEV